VEYSELTKYFRKLVNMNVSDGDMFRTIEGKVQAVTATGLVIKTRSGSEAIELPDVIDIEEAPRQRRRRVIRRYVRVLAADSNVRQHLADRHGYMIDLLNASDDETLFTMHEQLDHGELGHRHGDRPTRVLDAIEAERRIDQLGEYIDEDDDEDDDREEEDDGLVAV
jgi:hypothetical protein